MAEKIHITLSQKSIEEAIKKLEAYKKQLQFNTAIFVSKLAEIGLQTIDSNTEVEGDTNFNGQAYVQLERSSASAKATLVLHGEGVAFIEFGAGVHYNGSAGQSPNPFGAKLGYTIGSYGLGQGVNDSWVYYDENEFRYKTSQGTKAAMPMAKADEEIRREFIRTAKEVFG